jgi:hypothetical protein
LNKTVILQALALLRDATPLKTDCGTLCNRACCAPDGDGQGGVLLLPGERELYPFPWGQIEGDVLFCDAPCDRSRRPFNCRIFPLVPAKTKDGTWSVRMDRRASSLCPLFGYGIKGLDPSFVRAAKEAVRVLAQEKSYLPFLEEWSRREREFARQIAPL